MNRPHKTAIILLGFILILAGIIFVFAMMIAIMSGKCGDEPIGKYISPSSKHVIKYFIRDCGATTGFVDHVEIDSTLIFIGEAKDGKIPALEIKWIDDRKVSIEVSSTTNDLRIYKEPIEYYQDIDIDYNKKITDSYQKWKMGVK